MQASTLSCLEYSFAAYRCAAGLKKRYKAVLEQGALGWNKNVYGNGDFQM